MCTVAPDLAVSHRVYEYDISTEYSAQCTVVSALWTLESLLLWLGLHRTRGRYSCAALLDVDALRQPSPASKRLPSPGPSGPLASSHELRQLRPGTKPPPPPPRLRSKLSEALLASLPAARGSSWGS